MEARPLVSVLTPVHNGAEYLAEAIESVLAQSHGNWRHEIVDNASTDATGEIARSYAAKDPRITVHRYDELVTQIPNFNRMFGHTHPDAAYIKVLHADDKLFPECLTRMVDVAERNPSAVIVGAYRLDGGRVNLDSLPRDVEVVPGAELARRMLAAEMKFIFGSPTSLLLRAAPVRAYERVHDESFLHAGDSELCYRLLQGGDFGFVHEVLTFTRRHEGSTRPWAVGLGLRRAEEVRMLQRWGPVYLSREEYERRITMALSRYVGALAARVRNVRDPEFRRHQAGELRRITAGGGFGPVTLARGALRGAHRRGARTTA
jgi:glycosyltransferase involved in cell wall biosynthesis